MCKDDTVEGIAGSLQDITIKQRSNSHLGTLSVQGRLNDNNTNKKNNNLPHIGSLEGDHSLLFPQPGPITLRSSLSPPLLPIYDSHFHTVYCAGVPSMTTYDSSLSINNQAAGMASRAKNHFHS